MRIYKSSRMGAGILAVICLFSVSAVAQQHVKFSTARVNPKVLSSGGKAWVFGPQPVGSTQTAKDVAPTTLAPNLSFGNNVDASNPSEDVAGGQSETAIAAVGSRVMAAWNDASGFLVQPTTGRKASLTGVGFSSDSGHSFADLFGLPNNNPNEQWSGDPVVKVIDSSHFIVASLYLPNPALLIPTMPLPTCATPAPKRFEIAVSVATVSPTNQVTFTAPIIVANGGNLCTGPNNLALLDKEWMTYDRTSRTLAVSYTRFFFGLGGQSGNGQIEVKRAHVPTDPTILSSSSFGAPIIVWPEESAVVNQGSYVAVAPGGNIYVAWERNWVSNLFNGNPYVYIQAALVPQGLDAATEGGTADPVVVTSGQINSHNGGVKSLDGVNIAGYNRGIGQDFPRIAFDPHFGQVLVVWNDASAHPLGDVWLRALSADLDSFFPIHKVNDDSDFVLHFLPAISIRSDGSIAISWYDRRRFGASSTKTDYFGEIRPSVGTQAADFRITTGATDWNGTSTLIIPNFGDYTDNGSSGMTTYFTWSDGRLGVPQPFVSKR